jgi:hypothetical protein
MNYLKHKQLPRIFALSSICVLFTYTLLFIFTNYSTLYFAYDFDIGAYFDIGGIRFEVDQNNPLWTRDAIVTVLLAQPLTALVIGIASLLIFISVKKLNPLLFFMLLWFILLGLVFAFGPLFTDVFTKTSIYVVTEKLGLSLEFMVFFLAVNIYILFRFGKVNAQVFWGRLLSVAGNDVKQRIKILAFSVIGPWFLTAIIFLGLTENHCLFDAHLQLLFLFFMLLPIFFCKCRQNTSSTENKEEFVIRKVEWIAMLLMVVATVAALYLIQSPVYITT